MTVGWDKSMGHHYEEYDFPRCCEWHRPLKKEITAHASIHGLGGIKAHLNKEGKIWCTHRKGHDGEHGYSTTGFKWATSRE